MRLCAGRISAILTSLGRGAVRAGLWLAIALVLGLGVSACSGKKSADLAFKEEPVGKLYNEGLDFLERGRYTEAAEKFEEVERQHPYSVWARKAIVMTAYAYYQKGKYDECIEAAERYLALHPGSEDAAYAQFLIAQSYYDQIPDVTRDQERTQRALEALREVARRYPDTEYARDARHKVQQAFNQIGGKEMEIGRYYLVRKDYVAAINRFKTVVTEYQTSSHVEEALMRLTEAYMAIGITSEAQTATAILGHNYPASPWYKDAYALLQSGGLEPREDKKSWLSRAWKATVGL
ncbi:MAG: outer membrane protein assembly factor BamD [Rhodobiaceae bacterium]|nr:outer membrane protein assembly factor BamD [Rhodobiaceae bacterium]